MKFVYVMYADVSSKLFHTIFMYFFVLQETQQSYFIFIQSYKKKKKIQYVHYLLCAITF